MTVALEDVLTLFPAGTLVGAYLQALEDSGEPRPIGSAIATAEVTGNGSLTFNSLDSDGTLYVLGANLEGHWRLLRVATPVPLPAGVTPADLFAIGMGKARLVPTEDQDRDTENLQEALGNESPNEVLLGGGVEVYRVAETIEIATRKKLTGAGRGVSLLHAVDGLDDDVVRTVDYEEEGVIDVTVRDLTIDGNMTHNAAGHCLATHGQRVYVIDVEVINAAQDGRHTPLLDAESETDKAGGGLDSRDVRVQAANCGRYGIFRDDHDFSLLDCSAIQCADTGIYTDANGLLVNCHTWSYAGGASGADTGIRLATDVRAVNCTAEGSQLRQVLFAGSTAQWIGGEVFAGTNFPNCPGMEIAAGVGSLVIDGVYIHAFGTGGALLFTGDGVESYINAHIFDAEGNAAGVGVPSKRIQWDVRLGGATARGTIPGYAVRNRFTLAPLAAGLNIPINTFYVDEADANLLKFKDNAGTSRRVPNGSRGALATAADNSAVDLVYGEAEQKVIENLRARVGELVTKLGEAGITV